MLNELVSPERQGSAKKIARTWSVALKAGNEQPIDLGTPSPSKPTSKISFDDPDDVFANEDEHD